jgi:hypothetical protein
MSLGFRGCTGADALWSRNRIDPEAHQTRIDGRETGLGAIGDAELGVDMFDVVACRLSAIDNSAAISRFDRPCAISRNTSTCRSVSPAGQGVRGRVMPRRCDRRLLRVFYLTANNSIKTCPDSPCPRSAESPMSTTTLVEFCTVRESAEPKANALVGPAS